MSNIYIYGNCYFETTAIKLLLNSIKISSHTYSFFDNNNHITKSDSLILCLSSPPILGWAKYLSLINFIYYDVKCKIIILMPKHFAYLLNYNNRIIFLCGKSSIEKLLSDLTKSFHIDTCIKNQPIYKKIHYWVLNDLIENTSTTTQSLRLGLNYKTIFHYRIETMRYLGFSSYHIMSVYFSNSNRQTIPLLKKLLYSCSEVANSDNKRSVWETENIVL